MIFNSLIIHLETIVLFPHHSFNKYQMLYFVLDIVMATQIMESR